MKIDFTHENFEHFLKQNADNLRMKAPDKVWQNLSRELNKRRRRLIIGLSAFLFIAIGSGYYIISNSSPLSNTSTQSFTHQKSSNAERPTTEKSAYTRSDLPNHGITKTTSTSSQQRTAISYTKKKIKSIETSANLVVLQSTQPDIDQQVSQNTFTPTIIDSYPEANEPSYKMADLQSTELKNESLPYTIESVINTYKRSKKAKWETQIYFAPTISYRKLTENKSYLRTIPQSPSNYPSLYSSVNSNVTHKPDVGFELGFTTKYSVSDKIKLRGGLQFNVNRYDVKAFSSSSSLTTIALNNGLGIDSLNTFSNYSNVNGYKSNWLQNLYFQVSAPVGFEINFKGTDKVHFGAGTSIQPTYVLGDRAYLITTDYKNYAQVPWLVRRWNVNTALETFVVYNSGKATWQIGPQVRYQLLSSFISKYPVKENLFDFGLKVGISLNK